MLSHLKIVALAGEADAVVHFVGGQAHDKRVILAAAVTNAVDYLGDESHAVFKAAAVLVCALIRVRRQKLLDHIAVAAVQLNSVDPGLFAPLGSCYVIVNQVFDLAAAHGVNAHRAVVCKLALRRCLHRPNDALFLHTE